MRIEDRKENVRLLFFALQHICSDATVMHDLVMSKGTEALKYIDDCTYKKESV